MKRRRKLIDLTLALEQLTGLRIDASKLESDLVELRTYSQTEVLWLLTRAAAQIIHAETSQLLQDHPLDTSVLKAFRQVAGLRERSEKALQARIDNWLASGALPAVPVKTLASGPQTLPLKDSLLASPGYYLRADLKNQRPIVVVIGDRTQSLTRGGQMTITPDDIAAGVRASGEGMVVRWARMPSPEPKRKSADVFPLPRRIERSSRARDYTIAVLIAAAAGAAVWWFNQASPGLSLLHWLSLNLWG